MNEERLEDLANRSKIGILRGNISSADVRELVEGVRSRGTLLADTQERMHFLEIAVSVLLVSGVIGALAWLT